MAYYNELDKYNSNVACKDSEGREITYHELWELSHRMGRRLKKNSVAFSFCRNAIGAIIGYISFLNNKVVPLLLKPDIDVKLLERLLDLYQPAYVYLPQIMKIRFEKWECIWEAWDYCLMENPAAVQTELYSELALLLTTSGSTGSPKLVKQSYGNIQSNAEAVAKYLELDETERPITTLPMNYTYGLSIINSHLLAGSTILLTEDSVANREFWEFFKAEGATSFGGVPYTYEILKKLKFFRMNLPSLRTMTQAGGKLSPELHKEFAEYAKEKGKHFVVMYGQTEATARMGYLPWKYAVEKCGSMGIAIPGGRFSLIDAAGAEIHEPDVEGELVYEGPNVTLGYAECSDDLIKGDERKGKLVTGDMAKRDADGYYYIVGRKKRFLKIFGNRVNLDETERLIKRRYQGLECACAGVDDKMTIYITDEKFAEDVKMYIAETTGLNHIAFCVKHIQVIPQNDAGKVLYKELESYS